MQIVTIKAKPKVIIGALLALIGIIAVILTFALNHSEKAVSVNADISCKTAEERRGYLLSLGYEPDETETEKSITIPAEFNEVYTEYNEIQKKQGFNLEAFKGKQATLYTYKILNYEDNPEVTANLIVYNGTLIGADLCDPSADGGFLKELITENGTA